jgi:hypothetical protein
MADELRKTGQLRVISIDDEFDTILQYDKAGESLRFETGSRFRELSRRELNRLTRENQIRYEVALSEQHAVSEPEADEEEEILQRIMTSANTGRAITRLRVDGKRAGHVYSWQRPDMVDQYMAERGWKPVVGGPERTAVNRTGKGAHVIQKQGQDEMVLMSRTVKVAAADRRAKKERNRKYREGIAQAFADKISEAGGQPVEGDAMGAFSSIENEE